LRAIYLTTTYVGYRDGRRKVGHGGPWFGPLDFEILYFPVNVLVEKRFLLV